MLGKHIPTWSKPIPAEFRDFYHPLIIPVLMAEILRDKARGVRGNTLNQIRKVEGGVESVTKAQIGVLVREQNARTQHDHDGERNEIEDYSSLSLQLAQVALSLGVFKLLIERIDLLLKFVVEDAKDDLIPPIPAPRETN